MQSQFSIRSFLVLVLSVAFLALLYKTIPAFFNDPYYEDKLFPKIFVPSILCFTTLYLVAGEWRTKIIKVQIESDRIKVKRFLGLKTETYFFSEIAGWKYSLLPSRGRNYEYLYLYKNDKKVIKISEFYHRNYKKLKQNVQNQYKYLGFEKFSYMDEFKEIFR